ncbi:MAG TPA: ABC transporter permease subunit [Casimicrobiaceae bacterium]|nr:ABC transporter permease subunit [Casimicrobiaceae bacterium]
MPGDHAFRRLAAPALGVGTVIGAFAAVEGLIRAGVINRFVVPLPSQVLAAIPRIVAEESVPHRFWQTTQEALAASVLLVVVGIALGMLMFRFRLLRSACETWVAALASAPIVLMYPLFLVIFGRSGTTIVMIAFVAGLPPVILKTVEGLAGTRTVLLDVGRSFRLDNAKLFRKILLPAALPSIFVGLRVGLIFMLINIVGVEFLINFGGLGQLINELAERYDLPGTYGAILFVILASVLFFVILERAERWLLPRTA